MMREMEMGLWLEEAEAELKELTDALPEVPGRHADDGGILRRVRRVVKLVVVSCDFKRTPDDKFCKAVVSRSSPLKPRLRNFTLRSLTPLSISLRRFSPPRARSKASASRSRYCSPT